MVMKVLGSLNHALVARRRTPRPLDASEILGPDYRPGMEGAAKTLSRIASRKRLLDLIRARRIALHAGSKNAAADPCCRS